ncbi:hypothetical protein CYPRO_3326 [Cyclonatronum proteinivorum]|uniref:Uncharacterized protein n=1 Tax=Cyclonatronum proteinivorum TaxID=1457365 RepID=A0A345UQ06_9BACT|nr:hypothetical protein [Cyclonatronum proteinivorum]AXJ02558.1 hypothetical protein CYPRO_3326 [Cyclonatronum proteinivorum]
MPEMNAEHHPTEKRIWRFSYIRVLVFILIITGYIFALRPGRALITEHIVYPVAAEYASAEAGRFHLPESTKSVTFTLYERVDESWAERIYSTPWGFYFILPLLFFCFIAHYKPYLFVHVLFQMIFGIVAILSYLWGISLTDVMMHVYRMVTYYLTPGASFIIIFAAVFQQSFMQSRKT